MQVYALPDELTATLPEHDYANDSHDQWVHAEETHRESIRTWLKEHGCTGKNSGLIYRTPFADGCAEYMMVEGRGIRSYLLHLPYCDAYHDPNVTYIPKKEILKRIQRRA